MVLVAIYFVYELYDFKIYQDIEEVLSSKKELIMRQRTVNGFAGACV